MNDVTRKSSHLSVAGSVQPLATARIQPVSPIDLRPLPALDSASRAMVEAAVANGRIAHQQWRLRTLEHRVAALRRAAKEMLRRRGEVRELAKSELGKVDIEGLFNEGLGPLEMVNGWAKVIAGATTTRQVRLNPLNFPKKRAEVQSIPRGVVGIIAPWNFPVAGLYRSIFPALLTGNAVVLKPSEYTPRTSAWLAERLAEELPEGLISVVQGVGAVGAALIDAGIEACVFTGSSATGRKVRLQCAERGIPSSVEMGGKDAALVLEDCDLDRTVAGLTHWALSNVGQACGAIEVAYVDAKIADALVERLSQAWRKLTIGASQFDDLGPLGNQRQFDVVVAQVAEARAQGAKVVCGGEPTGRGLGFAPTLLDHCSERMAVVSEETFGPVLAIVRVAGADGAIRQINAARYGLGASIWTQDLPRARRLAERIEVGVVTINNHSFTGAIPALPWSGTRQTGFGIANGPESLATFVRPKTVVVDASRAVEPFWLPYDRALWELGNLLADLQLGKIGGAWKLPLLLRERTRTVRRFFKA